MARGQGPTDSIIALNRVTGRKPALSTIRETEYGEIYFMTAPRFETGDERYAWLNDLVCVGEGKRLTEGVAYRVYAVVNS